jgi:neurobeachin-like protein 1/2
VQGGRFDHADRLFTSLPRAWSQVLKNSSDVKEMVPEFFYNPAFLTNREALPLGHLHSGAAVGDVALPTWARGSPDEFIRIHRCALCMRPTRACVHAFREGAQARMHKRS